jgi:phosphoribosylglycinamide formyltransferase-1
VPHIAAVISNRPDAAGLAFAVRHGIQAQVVDHKAYPSREAFDAALAEPSTPTADLVVLAGFMRVLTDGFVSRYAGRLLNIHPSLLPSFPGCTPIAGPWRPACGCMARRCISSRRPSIAGRW